MREDKIDIQEVKDNSNKLWNKFWLSRNKQLTVKDIETLQLPNSIDNWDWCWISATININEVRNNPYKHWHKYGLSHNIQLTVKDIETLQLPNSTADWDWDIISQYINMQEVIDNPTKPWDEHGLQWNNDRNEKLLEFFNAGLLKHLQKNIYKFKYRTDISIKCEQ